MTRRYGNSEWRALSDSPPEPDYASDVELWQTLEEHPLLAQAVARGDCTLEQVLDKLTSPDAELCPRCAANPIRMPTGLCIRCHKRAITEATLEVLAEAEGLREQEAARQGLCRLRRTSSDLLPVELRARKLTLCECGSKFYTRDTTITKCRACRGDNAPDRPAVTTKGGTEND